MLIPPPIEATSLDSAETLLPPTKELIALLLKTTDSVSDIFLSPMRPPEVRAHGRIMPANISGVPALVPDDTRRIAHDLISHRPVAQPRLESQGTCDFAFFLPRLGRFRVNIFSQRGSYAIAIRVIPDPDLPTFESLALPPQLDRLVQLRSGLVIVSGPAGSGKSSTLAAVLNRINEQKEVHIVTIEDPIEFQFRHRRATVLQRELYRDVPSFPVALRSSLRHPPHVILLSAIPNRATLDLALEAADCGHLVFAALHTPDASRAVGYLLRLFPAASERTARVRLARSLRAIASQHLFPRKDRPGQVAIFEILFSTPRIRECIAQGEDSVMSLTDAIREGVRDGMQGFESEFWKLQQAGILEPGAASQDPFGDWIPAPPRAFSPGDLRRPQSAQHTKISPAAPVESGN